MRRRCMHMLMMMALMAGVLAAPAGAFAATSGCGTVGQRADFTIKQVITNSLVMQGWVKHTVYRCWSGGSFTRVDQQIISKGFVGVESISAVKNNHDLLFNTYDKAVETKFHAATLRCTLDIILETQIDDDDGLTNRLTRQGGICLEEVLRITSVTWY